MKPNVRTIFLFQFFFLFPHQFNSKTTKASPPPIPPTPNPAETTPVVPPAPVAPETTVVPSSTTAQGENSNFFTSSFFRNKHQKNSLN